MAAPPVVDSRLPLLDAVKGVACVVIVGHHLARYGPMPEVAYPLAPGLIHWLSQYGRLAVQVFLVLAGFLAAASLAPDGRLHAEPALRRIALRYVRLVMPYLAALTFSVVVAALVRPWLHDEAVPAAPSLMQLLAHGLLLQDLLGYDALSAGVWYVAIDFQLFVLALALIGAAGWLDRHWPSGAARPAQPAALLVLALAFGSLMYFNLQAGLDVTALYFFGAYGLGMLTFWADRAARRSGWWAAFLLLALLGAAALAVEWRSRIAVAVLTAMALSVAQRLQWFAPPPKGLRVWPALPALGRISYSLFLVHFPVILLVSAAVARWVPPTPWWDAAGMVGAFVLSLAAAVLLYRVVESQPASWRAVLGLFAALLVCGQLAAL